MRFRTRLAFSSILLVACSGSDGSDGRDGKDGGNGAPVSWNELEDVPPDLLDGDDTADTAAVLSELESGSLELSGGLTAASITTTGSVSAASITTTGSVSAASITATGSVTAESYALAPPRTETLSLAATSFTATVASVPATGAHVFIQMNGGVRILTTSQVNFVAFPSISRPVILESATCYYEDSDPTLRLAKVFLNVATYDHDSFAIDVLSTTLDEVDVTTDAFVGASAVSRTIDLDQAVWDPAKSRLRILTAVTTNGTPSAVGFLGCTLTYTRSEL